MGVGDAQCLADQTALGIHKPCEVSDRNLVEGHRNGQPGRFFGFGLFLLGLCKETSSCKMLDEVFNFLTVGAIIELQITFLGNREVIDLVGCTWHSEVLCLCSGELADGLHQCFSVFCFVVNGHCNYLL